MKVEIPLSRILKAQALDENSVVPFGFVEIEATTPRNPHSFLEITPETEELTQSHQKEPDATVSAKELLLEAERRAAELEEEGYRKGFEQGQKDGFEYGQKSMAIVKDHLERFCRDLEKMPQQILGHYRNWLVETSLSIARHIIRREVKGDLTHLSNLIDELLAQAHERHNLSLWVHPDDFELLKNHTSILELSSSQGRQLSLRADPGMERGGCRLESDLEVLDASIEKQFSLLGEILKPHEVIPNDISK